MTIDRKLVTVGSDAELPVFLADGTPYPVIGLVGGTKQLPKQLPKLGKGFAVQEDNVNYEFNIPPATDRDHFLIYIETQVQETQRQLPPGMHVRAQAATEYKPEFLQTQEAQQFGCEPDYNVWTMEENPKPKCDNPLLRTASGHIHVGWPNPTMEDRVSLVKCMDYRLGIWNVGRDAKARRQLYGKAGAHRPKEYGIEYRVLGNAWLFDRLARSVFDLVIRAVDDVNAGVKFTDEEAKIIQDCINNDQITDEFKTLRNRIDTALVGGEGTAYEALKKQAAKYVASTPTTNVGVRFR